MRDRLVLLVTVVVAAATAVGLVMLALPEAGRGPLRCAGGLVALGARCCGGGQELALGQCRGTPTSCSSQQEVTAAGCVAVPRRATITGGTLRLAPSDWEAQGVVEARTVEIAAFELDAFEVTEARYRACVAAGSCEDRPDSDEPGLPVRGVTYAEAERFCAWSGGRLPSPEELAFAAAGPEGKRYAWGNAGAVCRRAAWGLARGPCAEGGTGPETAGARPDGGSPDGIFDLAGNVAEWAAAPPAAVEAEARGGSYADRAAAALRHWHREMHPKSSAPAHVGFRCAY